MNSFMNFLKKIPQKTLVVIAALIALIGVILGKMLDVHIANIPIHATQTAEARLTELATIFTATLSDTPAPPATPTILSPVNAASQASTQPLAPTATSTFAPLPTSSYTSTVSLTFTPTSIPITPISFENFFRECRDHTFGGGGGTINVYPSCNDAEKKETLQLTWAVPNVGSYAGCTISLPAAGKNKALVLWARGIYGNEQISIKLKDASHEEGKLIALPRGWQQVVLTFLIDFPGIDRQQLKQLTIGISYDPTAISSDGKGSACLSGIGFGSP